MISMTLIIDRPGVPERRYLMEQIPRVGELIGAPGTWLPAVRVTDVAWVFGNTLEGFQGVRVTAK
jgi:hypothetical protein